MTKVYAIGKVTINRKTYADGASINLLDSDAKKRVDEGEVTLTEPEKKKSTKAKK